MYGRHGCLLRVDVGSGTAAVESIASTVYDAVVGGVGLATYLLLRFCPPGVDPLGPANPLVLATSPFVGTGITTASKLAVAARSPQTGLIGDSLSSSYLTIELKRIGADALVVTGQAAGWSTLVVDGLSMRLQPADDLLGLDPTATAERLRETLGAEVRVAAIGSAGERGVRYAAIANDGRLAGRTGAGAVMGSKRLKAIAVRGHGLPPVADPAGLARRAEGLAARSLGPETEKYRQFGTVGNLARLDRLEALPTRNFHQGSFAGAGSIDAEVLAGHRTDRHACAACTVGCEHHFRTRDGGASVEGRLEYESLFALGSLCGIDDPNAIVRAAALCDRLGMDMISAGGTVAWAMECVERGVALPARDAELPRFGDAEALLRTLAAIGARRGIGDLLAEGSRRASAVVGQGSAEWAMHVKGLELPGYDPRRLPTMALGLAVGARGACQNRSSGYDVDLAGGRQPATLGERAAAAAAAEDQAAVLDSLTICKFLRRCFDDLYGEAGELHEMVTGRAVDLRQVGSRIVSLKKLFNQRQGWRRDDDGLPARALAGDLSPERLDGLIDAYYRVRGWDAEGRAPEDTLVG